MKIGASSVVLRLMLYQGFSAKPYQAFAAKVYHRFTAKVYQAANGA